MAGIGRGLILEVNLELSGEKVGGSYVGLDAYDLRDTISLPFDGNGMCSQ